MITGGPESPKPDETKKATSSQLWELRSSIVSGKIEMQVETGSLPNRSRH